MINDYVDNYDEADNIDGFEIQMNFLTNWVKLKMILIIIIFDQRVMP